MSVVFPNSNLPTSSQPWGREVQKQLASLIDSSQAETINNSARDNQLNSSIIALTGVVNDISALVAEVSTVANAAAAAATQAQSAADAAQDAADAALAAQNSANSAYDYADTAYDTALFSYNATAGLGSSGSTLKVNADNIYLGAITAASMDLTSSSYELKVGTSSSFAYLRCAPGAPNGVGINAIGIVSSSTGGVIGAWYPYSDGVGNCGIADFRWNRLYATNATVLTSDSRLKNDIKDASLGLEFIEKLRPVSYKMNVGQRDYVTNDEGELQYGEDGKPLLTERPGIRRHWGLVAQEVKQVLDELEAEDFAGYVVNNLDDPDSLLSLSYEQFISPMIKAIQELSAKVAQLEGQING